MDGTQDQRHQPGQTGKSTQETGQEHRQATDLSHRPQQPEKASRGLDEETKRRREEDMVNEGDVEGDEL